MQRAQHTKDIKKATVFKWLKRFKDGISNISDDARSGRPSVITVDAILEISPFFLRYINHIHTRKIKIT